MKKTKRFLTALLLLATVMVMTVACAEAKLPKKIEVQVPAKAGGGTDVMARALTQEIGAQSGAKFTVVNNTDGAGVVACETVRNAKPDGSKLLAFHTTRLIKSATGVYDKKATEDFKVIAVGVPNEKVTYFLLTNSNSGLDSMEKFVEYAKANETKMGIETGGQAHILSGLTAEKAGLNLRYVESGSATEQLTALVGGTVDAVFVNGNQAKQYIEAGKVFCIAAVGDGNPATRSSILPDVPNMQELGYDISWNLYNFILGPASMDDELAKLIWNYYAEAAKSDAVNEILVPAGMDMEMLPYEEGLSALKAMEETLDPVIEALGLKQ